MVRRFLLALVFLLAIPLSPLLAADAVHTTLVPLKTPRKSAPRLGGPLDKVELAIWVPGDVKTIRGALVNPLFPDAVKQEHWQAACRHWGFAIIGANYIDVRDAELKDTLLAGLKDFAGKAKREEIAHLPLVFAGTASGAAMCIKFADAMPDRTLAVGAVGLDVGPRTPASFVIPTITIIGERDSKQMQSLGDKLPTARKQGAQWAVAVQWGRGGEFGRAGNLLMPFFDYVVRTRYPRDSLPLGGPIKLRDLDEKTGWIADQATWRGNNAKVDFAPAFKGDKAAAGWVPDETTAAVWRAFVSQKPKVTILAPLGQGDTQTFTALSTKQPITVDADVDAALNASSVELLSGALSLGKMTVKGGRYTLTVPSLKPGIHALIVVATTGQGEAHVSQPNTVIIGP